jgi:hypothetical protein
MRGGYPVDPNPTEGIFWRQMGLWVVVELLAGDGMHLKSTRRQVGGDITDQLACGGMIRRKEAVEEENALHQGPSCLVFAA